MLQAMSKEGKMVILALLPQKQIEQLKQTKAKFYCPICKNSLTIKAGPRKIAHFAHQLRQHCPNHAGGEGIYHENGKLDLFFWLKNQGYNIKLEHYLPEIKQRADLYIHFANKQLAIEYQCAALPLKDLLKRTSGYQSARITPLWILGGNRMKRLGNQGLHLNYTEQNYLHQFANDPYAKLLFYCPEMKQIARYDLIGLSGRKRSVGHLQFFNLEKTRLTQLLQPQHFSSLTPQWLVEKKRFRLHLPNRTSSDERKFREWLYLNRLYPSLLSSWIGLPVANPWLMNVPIWTWQTYLCYDFFNASSQFTHGQLERFIHPFRRSVSDQFSMVKTNADPVLSYLNYFLFGQKIKREKEMYHVQGTIAQYQSVEQALTNDRRLQLYFTKARHFLL